MGIFYPAAVAAVVLGTVYSIWTVIYRLYFDPLAKYPGPLLNRISPIPSIISLLKGRIALDVKRWHDQYGPVIRVTPTELSFNSVAAWEDIYGHRQGLKNMHKDPVHVGSVAPLAGVSTLTMANDDDHARQRRALAYAFSNKALLEQEHIVQGYVDLLLEKMTAKQTAGVDVNLVDYLNYTTFDIIGDLAFGEPFGCLSAEMFHDWVSLVFETIKVGALEQATRRLATAGGSFQTFLVNRIPQYMRDLRVSHLTRSREKVLKRLAQKDLEHRDFIWYILQQQKRHDLKQDEIIVNGALFIVAGSETTANLLSGLFARLIWNPDKYAKLVEELRSNIKDPADLVSEKLKELPYMNACIEEGLRIHPPVPVGLLRTVPKGGAYIDGNFVVEGTSVAVNSWAACHNPVNFKDCDSFIPERWIDEKYASDQKKAMQPFSLGPRGCIGRHLSYMEMRVILGRLLWNFDIVSTDGAWKWNPEGELKHMRAFNTWEKPELMIKLVPVVHNK
ncbi:cytochrome P450 [Microthyrium microscopicum]|uniref:Cytochrome P450 n=1 Tax=Microthyrium microscopicum TaxID=703497 RepID=A0A6A6UD01_9PEZI|nr:cytochrome P450 [Microthyrium microscopicum]